MLSRRPRPTESFSFLRASSIFLSFRFQVFSFLSIAPRAYRADDRDTERVLPDDDICAHGTLPRGANDDRF